MTSVYFVSWYARFRWWSPFLIMNDIILTKESSDEQIREYFNAILELSQSNNEYPVNMDNVWMLVYNQKSDAVDALKRDFMEGIDYKVLRQKPQNPNGGRPINEYHISLSCLEFFIARKVRAVFEVYRKVFHGITKQMNIPQTFAEALRLAAEQAEQLERQQKLIAEQKPKAEYFDALVDRKLNINFRDTAKEIGIKEKDFIKFLLDKEYVYRDKKGQLKPIASYVDKGLFEIKEWTNEHKSGNQTLITPKGRETFRLLLKGC